MLDFLFNKMMQKGAEKSILNGINPLSLSVADTWMNNQPMIDDPLPATPMSTTPETKWDRFLAGVNDVRNAPSNMAKMYLPNKLVDYAANASPVGMPQLGQMGRLEQSQPQIQPMQSMQFNNPQQNQEVLKNFQQIMQSIINRGR